MNFNVARFNLIVAWVWIVLGFALGFVFGLNFHKENWLGGYGSYRRRLYRLAHVSFFGLGMVNFLYYWTARDVMQPSVAAMVASRGFVLGAVSMPVCCFIMAHRPRLRALFLIPVVSLLTGGILTVWEVCR